MTHDDDSVTPAFNTMRELDGLTAVYPAFRFSLDFLGRQGDRWVARRINGLDPGVHTVITADLGELHSVLASQESADHGR